MAWKNIKQRSLADGAGLAFGVGGGVWITKAMKLELEYKYIISDIDIFGLGLVYAF